MYLGTRGTVHPKYTLRMASDLAPYGWGALFSPCTPLGAPGIRLGTLWPKMAKNPPKRGYPLFGHFFRKVAEIQTPFSPIFEKKVRIFPPLDFPPALFFENRRKQGLDFCYLYKTVFLEGGLYNPL